MGNEKLLEMNPIGLLELFRKYDNPAFREDFVKALFTGYDHSNESFNERKDYLKCVFKKTWEYAGNEELLNRISFLSLEEVQDSFIYDKMHGRKDIKGIRKGIEIELYEFDHDITGINEDALNHRKARHNNASLNVEYIVIPRSIEYIGKNAFRNIRSLKRIFFKHEGDDKLTICQGAFADCSGLEEVRLPKNVCLRVAGMDAYESYRQSKAKGYKETGPDTRQTFGTLQKIVLPEGLKVEEPPEPRLNFIFRSIKKIEVHTSNKLLFKDLKQLHTVMFHNESFVEICDYMFEGCVKLKKITWVGKVEKVGKSAFAGCGELVGGETEELNLSEAEQILDFAFKGCRSLKKVTLLSLEEISESAFEDCDSIESVEVPIAMGNKVKEVLEKCNTSRKYRQEVNKWPNSEYSASVYICRE